MTGRKNIVVERCLICRKPVIKEYEILRPHCEFAFGIHPAEIRQWPDNILPFFKWECYICITSHSPLNSFISFMEQVLPFPVRGLNMPEHISWLGHWITATSKNPEFSIIFNVQLGKRQFEDIILLAEHIFPVPAKLIKNTFI